MRTNENNWRRIRSVVFTVFVFNVLLANGHELNTADPVVHGKKGFHKSLPFTRKKDAKEGAINADDKAYRENFAGLQGNIKLVPALVMQLKEHAGNNPIDSSLDLYLLIGQSNMSGRGSMTSKYTSEGAANVLMLNKDNKWVPAKHPLHFDKPSIVGVGPGLSFGIEMSMRNSAHKIGLVPCAVGGTSIDKWKPDAYDSATKTHPYDDMMRRIEEAQKSGKFKGVIWLQGESDANPKKASVYLVKLEELIRRIRQVTNDPELPFVAGELGRFKVPFNVINLELKKLPGAVAYTSVASSKGLKDKGDKTHFDAASAEKYGKRFARKMKQLQRKLKRHR